MESTQVAGHLFEEGKAGSLVDDRGHFYKPIQPGPRGDRERAFYEAVAAAKALDKAAWARGAWSDAAMAAASAAASPFSSSTLPAASQGPPRQLRPVSPPVAVPAHPSNLPQFPSFRTEASFKEGGGLHRDHVEVLQRDALGLVGEEDEWWDAARSSDREGASGHGASGHSAAAPISIHIGPQQQARQHRRAVVPEGHDSDGSGDGAYSRSPDSDDGAEHTTGDAVMDGISKAFGSGRRQVDDVLRQVDEGPPPPGGTAAAEGVPVPRAAQRRQVAGYTRAEDAQAAALLGQPTSYEWGGRGASPEGPHFGASRKSSSTSTDSVDDVLRLHQLALTQRPLDASGSGAGGAAAGEAVALPFTARNAPLLRVIPKFYGVLEADGRVLLELEDLARCYRHPCIMDIKVGKRTWYPQAEAAYIERCKAKDASTTQAALGFKICGMQVYRHAHGGYWRASKRWCKTLPEVLVDKALVSFAHNEHGLRPRDVYGGPHGAVAQLQALEAWFDGQREFHFYSSSLLLMYEGDAEGAAAANVRVRLVDFAHTFHDNDGRRDDNFLAGLRAVVARLSAVVSQSAAEALL